MTNDFASLKRSSTNNLDRLTKEIGKLAGGSNQRETDDRLWQPEVDKAGNGYAVIRFLPAAKGEDLPWVRIWSHGFQGPGGWYLKELRTSISLWLFVKKLLRFTGMLSRTHCWNQQI